MTSSTVLHIEDLNVGYNTYRGFSHVLKDLSMKVEKGQKIGVIGESGCGKTTTMKSIHQILASNGVIKSGSIYLNGKDVLSMGKKELLNVRRNNVSMIPQDPTASLNPLFKVETQMRDVLKYSSMKGEVSYSPFKKIRNKVVGNSSKSEKKDKEYYRERALQLFKDVKLSDPERVLDSYPFQLSGGMRQRVCIAMSIATPKDLLIADEPTTNLDVTIQDQVFRLIGDILEKENLSAIFVSQALGAIKKFVDRIYVVYGGSVIEVADTREIFKNPKHPYTIGLIESTPKLTGGGFSIGIEGQTPDYVNPPPGCRFNPRCKEAKEQCRNKAPELIELENNHFVACWSD